MGDPRVEAVTGGDFLRRIPPVRVPAAPWGANHLAGRPRVCGVVIVTTSASCWGAVYSTTRELHWREEFGEGAARVLICEFKIGPQRASDAMAFELDADGRIRRIRPHLRPWLATTLFALLLGPKSPATPMSSGAHYGAADALHAALQTVQRIRAGPGPLRRREQWEHRRVLLHTSHGNQVAFFEIAATLIPILLFGGVVAERLRPKDSEPAKRTWLFSVAIPVIGAIAITAEVVAINAVVTGNSNDAARLFVASALTVGLLAIIVALWLPWAERLRRHCPKWGVAINIAVILLLVVAAVISVGAMTAGVESEQEGERVADYEAALGKKEAEQEVVWRRIERLSLEEGNLTLKLARFVGDPPGIQKAEVEAISQEGRSRGRLLDLAIDQENRLELEKVNLFRELTGQPPLRHLLDRYPRHRGRGAVHGSG